MNKTGRILSILLWVLLIISAILIVFLVTNINTENEADLAMHSWINNNLIWVYILLAIGVGVALLFSIFQMISDPKAAKRGLFGIIAMAIVVVIAYFLASNKIQDFPYAIKLAEEGKLTTNMSKWIGTGLFTTYILLFIAVLSIVASSLIRVFK